MARNDDNRYMTEAVFAAVCVLAVGLMLSFTATDLEKSAKVAEAEKVSAAITFSPPEKEEEKGFWDIFFESVSYMLPDGM